MMKSGFKVLFAATALSAALVVPAAADDWGGFSATITGTSDYRFRGISQTNNDPAVQGSIDWASDSGFYLGAWGSNIDFAEDIEVDLYGGYAFETEGGLGVDVSAVYYAYPGDDTDPEIDYWEFFLKLSHTFNTVTWSGQLAFSPNFFGETGTGIYAGTGLSVPINDWLSADANIGWQSVEDIDDVAGSGFPYVDWNVGLTATWENFSFDVRYIDVNLSEAQCGADICDATVVATISYTFSGGE